MSNLQETIVGPYLRHGAGQQTHPGLELGAGIMKSDRVNGGAGGGGPHRKQAKAAQRPLRV